MHRFAQTPLNSHLACCKEYLVILSLVLEPLFVNAQYTMMHSYNINDGLVCNQIRGFYQDRKGFIWILTWEGLSRFDGYAFRNYTGAEGLAHPLVNAVIEGKDGRMYIAENDGHMDVILNGEVQLNLRKKLDHPINKFIQEPSGRILAPSDNDGVRVFNEGSVQLLNNTGIPLSVNDAIPNGDSLIVCGIKSGLIRQDHTFLKLWPVDISECYCMLKDNLHRIWLGTPEGLRWANPAPDHAARSELTMTSFSDTQWGRWIVMDILQTSEHDIWVATTRGLIQIRPDQSWRLYSRIDGLPSEYITSLFEDRSGLLWIGTDKGFAKLDIKNTIDVFTISEDLFHSNLTDIQPTMDGSAFIVSNSSSVFKLKLNHPLQTIELRNHGRAYNFLIMGSDTLVTTDKGRYKLNNQAMRLWETIPYIASSLSLEMGNGDLFSTSQNVITISSPTESYSDSTLKNWVYAISLGTEGEIWLGTIDHGVYQVRASRNADGKMKFQWQDFNEYLPEKTIRSLHADEKGNIWIGTRYSGLIQLFRDSLTGQYATHTFDRSDGFISDFIKSIASDQDGNIWVGTHAGIEKLIPTPNGYRIFSFSRAHNFFAIITKLAVSPDQYVWCTTPSAVVRIHDNHYETIPPSVVNITSVHTAKKELTDPHDQLPFNLKHDENFMDIEFSSADHINGRQLRYSYRLAGSQDTTWSNPQPVHRVSYANLLPGAYSFEVRVLGWNGILGNKTSYQFNILPPFWQQTWFVLLSILAVLALLYAFYRYRISQMKRIQVVRDRIASDLHDEIGSSLTHVNILSEIGKVTKDHTQPQQLFKRIGEEVQSSSEALDDIIWSVSSRADTAEDLISRMRRYASELFDAKGISCTLQEDHIDQDLQLDLELRRDFYLIYKEILRNVIRHAEATRVEIRIEREGPLLLMVISDNGRGFDPNVHSDRHGLHSLKSRVAKWKGQFFIDSAPGKGTTVKIGLPVKSGISFQKQRNHSKE